MATRQKVAKRKVVPLFTLRRRFHPAGVLSVMLLPPRTATAATIRSFWTTPVGMVSTSVVAPAAVLLVAPALR